MNPCPRERLAELVRSERPDLIQDAGRVRALLGDACPDAHLEVSVLVAAVEENVPIRIQRSSGSLSVKGGQDRLARMLAQNRALTAGAASWAVQSWASVLGKGGAPDDDAEAAVTAVSDPGMRALPREQLRDLSQRYGADLLQDPRRVKGLIQDVAPGYRREQAVLVAAMEDGIPQRIAAASGPGPAKGDLARMAQTLGERRGLADAAALWGVQAWAWALGKGEVPADGTGTPEPPPTTEEAPPPAAAEPAAAEPAAAAAAAAEYANRRARAPDGPDTWGYTPPPREKRRRRPLVLVAVGVVLALLAVLAIANSGTDDTTIPISPLDTSPSLTDPPETTDETATSEVPSSLARIQDTYEAPSDSCEEETSDIPDGAEYVLNCTVSDVDVRYIAWDSVDSMDAHIDQYAQGSSSTEDQWQFESTPDTDEGRFIQFEYDDGSPGLAWTYVEKLLSGEAQGDTSTTHESLADWWSNL
jgi:hypothetical protein